MHAFTCSACGAPAICPRNLCRTLEHRCEGCRTDTPRRRPSGDVISEAAWPTRRGDVIGPHGLLVPAKFLEH